MPLGFYYIFKVMRSCDNDIISGHENSLESLSYLRASKYQNLVTVAPLLSTHTTLRIT